MINADLDLALFHLVHFRTIWISRMIILQMNLVVNNAQYNVLFTTRFDRKQHAILRVVYDQIDLKIYHLRKLT